MKSIAEIFDNSKELLDSISNFIGNLKQIFNLSFHISANGDKSWILRLFRHLSYREILGISWCFSA